MKNYRKQLDQLNSALSLLQGVTPLVNEAKNKINRAYGTNIQTDDVLTKIALDLRTVYLDLVSISKELGIETLKAEQSMNEQERK